VKDLEKADQLIAEDRTCISGWKDRFLGVLHGQGRDGVEFYTDKKVVMERWPKEWSRKF
jgi:hypothetical protein